MLFSSFSVIVLFFVNVKYQSFLIRQYCLPYSKLRQQIVFTEEDVRIDLRAFHKILVQKQHSCFNKVVLTGFN